MTKVLSIKDIRRRAGLTQQEFGDLIGVSRSGVCWWETGRCSPSAAHLHEIARIFNVEILQSYGVFAEASKQEAPKQPEPQVIEPPKPKRTNRVWIEPEKPHNDEHGDEIAAQMNAMLAKLGDAQGWRFSWNRESQQYEWGGPMGSALLDRGNWFNLNYLSK